MKIIFRCNKNPETLLKEFQEKREKGFSRERGDKFSIIFNPFASKNGKKLYLLSEAVEEGDSITDGGPYLDWEAVVIFEEEKMLLDTAASHSSYVLTKESCTYEGPFRGFLGQLLLPDFSPVITGEEEVYSSLCEKGCSLREYISLRKERLQPHKWLPDVPNSLKEFPWAK